MVKTNTAIRIAAIAGLLAVLAHGLTGVAPAVQAQGEATAIKYGQVLKDRITDKVFEINYKFEGKAKEVVIVRMDSDGAAEGLKTPAFRVLSGADRIIDSTRIFTLSLLVSQAVFRLPKDGEYTIVATRREGRAGKEVGRYVMKLDSAAPLEVDKALSDETDDKIDKYYLVEPEGPFTISYAKTSGKFRPAISMSVLKNAGVIDPVSELSGNFLDAGAMSVTPDKGSAYVIRVGKAFLSNSTGDVGYTLTLTSKNER